MAGFYKIKRKLSRDGAFEYTRESFFRFRRVCPNTNVLSRVYI